MGVLTLVIPLGLLFACVEPAFRAFITYPDLFVLGVFAVLALVWITLVARGVFQFHKDILLWGHPSRLAGILSTKLFASPPEQSMEVAPLKPAPVPFAKCPRCGLFEDKRTVCTCGYSAGVT
jgi:hypothetical protein